MKYKYEKLMEEWEKSLDDPILDPAFVTKVKEFQQKLEMKALTEEEITATDEELCKMFKEMHKLELVDSPEVLKERRKARILEAKNEFAEATTLEQINELSEKYADVAAELSNFIKTRVQKLQKAMDDEARAVAVSEGIAVVRAASYDFLESMRATYKDFPEVIQVIDERIEKERPAPPQDKTIREKLAAARRREWSYDQLRDIGIEPTGEHMNIEGVYLERRYMFRVYEIKSIDGKPV